MNTYTVEDPQWDGSAEIWRWDEQGFGDLVAVAVRLQGPGNLVDVRMEDTGKRFTVQADGPDDVIEAIAQRDTEGR